MDAKRLQEIKARLEKAKARADNRALMHPMTSSDLEMHKNAVPDISDLLEENEQLYAAINTYVDASEGFQNLDDAGAAILRMHRAIAGLYKAAGRTVKRPDFYGDDDRNAHMGIDPEDDEREWLEIWGDVAEPETEGVPE